MQNAAAKVREAYLMYARTVLPAPVSGFVAKRAVQLGQRVGPGAPLMAIVPLDQVWIDANFKEPQLAAMRVGQPVKLIADIYGGKVVYQGKVVGFGAGTGSAFALLPAQNATGNWIKVVQRVPVRIALDPQELAAHPLQVGLSMEAEVDTRNRAGERLPQIAQTAPAYATDVFHSVDAAADEHVSAIIAENGGSRALRSARRRRANRRRAGARPGRARAAAAAIARCNNAHRSAGHGHRCSARHGVGAALKVARLRWAGGARTGDVHERARRRSPTSIPAISGDLGVSPNQGTWVITSFAVANAISLPLTGWLTQRYGQVKLFLVSIMLFVIASIACGWAPSIDALIVFRVIQGAVAGPMIPLSQSLLLASYPKERAGTALAMWAITTLVAPVVGPLLGGWITDNIAWPWIFYINVPVGIVSAIVVWVIYKERETPTCKLPIDGVGLGLLVIWVGAMQIVLDRGKDLTGSIRGRIVRSPSFPWSAS